MKVYYLEKASQNFDRKKKSFNYPDYVWEVGSVWEHSSNFYSDVIDVFTDLEAAKKALNEQGFSVLDEYSYTTTYLRVTDYAITEYNYDLTAIKKDFDFIETTEDFIEALKNDPWGFNDYEMDLWGSGVVVEFSPRRYVAEINYNEPWDDKYDITEEKEFISDSSHYNAYLAAENWIQDFKTKFAETCLYLHHGYDADDCINDWDINY